MYESSIEKDSLCNKTVADKDSIIDNNNRTIKNDNLIISLSERQKSFLKKCKKKLQFSAEKVLFENKSKKKAP